MILMETFKEEIKIIKEEEMKEYNEECSNYNDGTCKITFGKKCEHEGKIPDRRCSVINQWKNLFHGTF